ncbi:MAG: YesL family protein [Acetatifactor sp.]
MKLFNLDSPVMQALGKMADLMWLNILTLICCIPIITVGPSLTALHYMALKIVRNEECYITRGFFKSFKENLKQGILIWLLMLIVILVLAGDFFIMKYSGLEFGKFLQIVIIAVGVLFLFTAMFVFPVLAKFENTLWRTIKNAFLMSIMQFPKTILMVIMFAVPPVLFVLFPQSIPVVILFGLSVPAWLSAKLYNKFFQKLEDQILEANPPAEEEPATEGEDERIFKDELDESLAEDTLTK